MTTAGESSAKQIYQICKNNVDTSHQTYSSQLVLNIDEIKLLKYI